MGAIDLRKGHCVRKISRNHTAEPEAGDDQSCRQLKASSLDVYRLSEGSGDQNLIQDSPSDALPLLITDALGAIREGASDEELLLPFLDSVESIIQHVECHLYLSESSLYVSKAGIDLVTLFRSLSERNDTAEKEVFFPLLSNGGEPLGVLTARSKAYKGLDYHEHRYLQQFAKVLAGLIEHSNAYTRISRSATYDDLTGFYGRRIFFELLDKELSKGVRNDHPTTVMMMDLDHFKAINDRYGHEAGDQVLKFFADLVRKVLRNSDIVGRVGGEEFAVLLPETTADDASMLARRVLQHASAASVDTDHGNTVCFTVSIGIACSAKLLEGGALMRQADNALYRAKRDGRNRVEVNRSVPLRPDRV